MDWIGLDLSQTTTTGRAPLIEITQHRYFNPTQPNPIHPSIQNIYMRDGTIAAVQNQWNVNLICQTIFLQTTTKTKTKTNTKTEKYPTCAIFSESGRFEDMMLRGGVATKSAASVNQQH